MGNPSPQQMKWKLEEQLQFIMAECGLADPADVPWIDEEGYWHKRLTGINGHLDVSIRLENGRYLPKVNGVATGYETLSEAQAACDEVARYRLPGVFTSNKSAE
jgi:hypothetical protein